MILYAKFTSIFSIKHVQMFFYSKYVRVQISTVQMDKPLYFVNANNNSSRTILHPQSSYVVGVIDVRSSPDKIVARHTLPAQ